MAEVTDHPTLPPAVLMMTVHPDVPSCPRALPALEQLIAPSNGHAGGRSASSDRIGDHFLHRLPRKDDQR